VEWVNWSGSQRATPAVIERPRSRAELARAVASGPGPVRVAGAGHSFSAAAVTDGTLLSLDALARVLDADAASGLVRVEAGIRLRALSRELHARGLAMPNLGDIDAQSLAGALSTGTHGTGTRLPNLSGQVESIELVLADGSERTLDHGDLLRAARVSLGALGVIAAVTLRCVPAFRLHNTDRPEPLEDVLAELHERADAHEP
jgi:L-gulonolactone oxidase